MSGGYIYPLSKEITRRHVRFVNRFRMAVAGDIYYRNDLDISKKYPTLIVGAPYGGVKEQGPCIYADELAKRGFVVLTFDQSFMGDSEGEPRNVSDPSIFVEIFSACIDYLGVKEPLVNREKIGIIGICGSGGFALSCAQSDTRVKAICTCSMYVMSDAARLNMDKEALYARKEQLSKQRWIDFENNKPSLHPAFGEEVIDKVPENMPEPSAEWMRFYALKRGHHINAIGAFTDTSDLSFINFDLLSHIEEISPRPILMIVGDRAHSRFFSENVYKKALMPKELYVVKDAEHIDLYDRIDRIPFDKIADFFQKNL